jgi:hypothetical protein
MMSLREKSGKHIMTLFTLTLLFSFLFFALASFFSLHISGKHSEFSEKKMRMRNDDMTFVIVPEE